MILKGGSVSNIKMILKAIKGEGGTLRVNSSATNIQKLCCTTEKSASELMPRVHRVVSLLKRWLLGTHQGAVSHKHLDYYLDEFTFRFNRRKSRSRGKLFYRLVQQAVAVNPATYKMIVHPAHESKQIPEPQDIGVT